VTETISPVPEPIDTQQLAQDLVARARAEGVDLVGPGDLLAGLTKTVLETALEAEMSEHVGYDKRDPAGRNGQNSRNGTRAKTVLTEVGPVEIEVPRDRDGSFDPVIVRKRQRRLGGIDQLVLSLTARGTDDRGGRRALRRGLRGQGQQGHHARPTLAEASGPRPLHQGFVAGDWPCAQVAEGAESDRDVVDALGETKRVVWRRFRDSRRAPSPYFGVFFT
jgi:hypothetical protein